MLRLSSESRVRSGAALVGVAGAFVLAGCSSTAQPTVTDTEEAPASQAPADTAAGTDSGTCVDGTYTADGSYQTPETIEEISVTLTLADGIVTDVSVEGNPTARESKQYQGQFIDGIAQEVVGVAIDSLDVSRVAGSSLTSGGFNAAVDEIKQQAAG